MNRSPSRPLTAPPMLRPTTNVAQAALERKTTKGFTKRRVMPSPALDYFGNSSRCVWRPLHLQHITWLQQVPASIKDAPDDKILSCCLFPWSREEAVEQFYKINSHSCNQLPLTNVAGLLSLQMTLKSAPYILRIAWLRATGAEQEALRAQRGDRLEVSLRAGRELQMFVDMQAFFWWRTASIKSLWYGSLQTSPGCWGKSNRFFRLPRSFSKKTLEYWQQFVRRRFQKQ